MKTEIEYWNSIYSQDIVPTAPSSFAIWASSHLDKEDVILDVGCGNGRDSFYLASVCNHVVGIDRSTIAVKANNEKIDCDNLLFVTCDVAQTSKVCDIINDHYISCVYSRFFLHSIPENVCLKFLNSLLDILPKGGKAFFEYRTDQDPLIASGERLSDSERVTDHYRRFINHDKFLKQMRDAGWLVKFEQEAFGLAVFGDQNPCVGRLVLHKE